MGRLIGIDYGNKRIGLAVTDPLGIFATPLTTISPADFEKFIREYIQTEEVDAFVVGYPVQLNNQPSQSVKYIDPFITRLKKLFPSKVVHLIDERFTSKMALETIKNSGLKKKARQDKSLVDKISASIILQSFIDSKNNKTDLR
jgi:putative Holliday junction resolvase